MKKTYVIGHKNPDTDTVCAAISYSYLKNKLGLNTEPRVLGNLNNETKYVLNYFNIPEPRYLNDVKVQIKDMNYLKNAHLHENYSIEKSFKELKKLGVTGLPLVDDHGLLVGYVNVKEMANNLIEGESFYLDTSYDNIIEVLNGKEILRYSKEIKGEIKIAAYKSKNFTETVELDKNNILIVADRSYIIDYAIEKEVQLIIVIGGKSFPEELLEKAKQKKINIIETNLQTFIAANKIRLCNYINTINIQTNPITMFITDNRNDFVNICNKYGHTNYPIIDVNNKCLGMLRLIDQNNYHKDNIILVDHNQPSQSVDGIEEANILEVVDHHNLGILGTNTPISFRTMPVGSTCSIIYEIFIENNIEIPKEIAGIMLSAILSDTLILKSPTTTPFDINVANKLSEITNIDIESFGLNLLKNGSSIEGMTIAEIVEKDFKKFKLDDYSIGIGQITTLDFEKIKENINDYIEYLSLLSDRNAYKITALFVTDIINNGSYLIFSPNSKQILEEAFNIKNLEQGTYLPNMVSRKKQLYPAIVDYLQNN